MNLITAQKKKISTKQFQWLFPSLWVISVAFNPVLPLVLCIRHANTAESS